MGPVNLEFTLRIEPQALPIIQDAITFETGASRAQTLDPAFHAYEHHGPDFGSRDPGALTCFFEDLILGRPLPLVLVTRAIQDLDTLWAIALFLHRDVALSARMPGIVAQVDMVHRRGLSLMGHLDKDFALFLRLQRAYFPTGLSQDETGNRLRIALGWIREYVADGTLPALGKPLAGAQVVERGTDGFVAAESPGDLLEAWVSLFREGHLRGLVAGPIREGRRKVLAARKSSFCRFNLTLGARLFNDIETAMGEPASWHVEGDWLWGPAKGTMILMPHLLEVLVRI